MDDYSADTDTTGAIEIGGSTPGTFESDYDADWFAVTLEAGTDYRFALDEEAESYAYLDLIGPDGEYIWDGVEYGSSPQPELYYVAETSGVHYLSAEGYGPGDYTISAGLAPEDIPGDVDTDADLVAGMPVTSDFRSYSDADWFRFTGASGGFYTVALAFSGEYDDPYYDLEITLYDAAGEYVNGRYFSDYSDDIEDGIGPIAFAVPEDGTYYLGLTGGGSFDSYTLTLDETDALPDDLPGDATTDAVLAVGETRDARFDYSGDRDAVRVGLEAGTPYRITLAPEQGRDYFDIDNPLLMVIDPAGEIVAEAQSDYRQLTLESFTPETDGEYLIVTEAEIYGWGRTEAYSVTVESREPISETGTAANDQFFGGIGDDTFTGLGGEDLIVGSEGGDLIDGGDGDDGLFGQEGRDTILGGAGNDHIAGNDQRDVLEGGAGNDLIGGGRGADVIDGGTGNDSVAAGRGSDTVRGGDGDDLISGRDGEDVILGGAGDDSIGGGYGSDIIYGGLGADTVGGGGYDDLIVLGAGDDSGVGGWGDDAVFGGAGDDSVYGGDGYDALHGGSGRDRLDGGWGRDTLEGGAGNDTMTGGEGRDVFVFDAGALGGNDEITDFIAAPETFEDDEEYYYYYENDADVILLRGVIGATDDPEAAYADLTLTETEDGVLLDYGNGTVLLAGVASAGAIGLDSLIFA